MTNLFRSAAGAMLAIVASAGMLAGCSDNASSPLPPNSDPLGNTATVKTSDPVPSSEANAVRENVRKNVNDSITVLPNEAAEIAMERYPGAELYAVNLDYDRDSVNYETIVRSNGNVYAVTVDPQTGQVIEQRQVNNYYYTTIIVVPQTSVRPSQACERARRIANGDVVEVNIESIENRTTYIIIILMPDNRYTTLYIDAESGRERKLKDNGDCELRDDDDDDDDHGDRHKNKKGKGHYRHGNGKGYGHYYHCECECTDDDGRVLPTGIVSLDSAASIARSYFTDTVRVTKIEIEVEDSTNVFYDVSLRGIQSPDTNEYEVRLNARTGALVSIMQTKGDLDSGEFRPRTSDSLVALSVARAAAIANTAGAVQAWTLEYLQAEAKWVYSFEILTAANERKTVVVDARTGTFIRVR